MPREDIGDPRFVFVPAEDESVDDSYELVGGDVEVSIQCAPYAGGYGVNSYCHASPGDGGGFLMRDHGMFTNLEAARLKALEVAGLDPNPVASTPAP